MKDTNTNGQSQQKERRIFQLGILSGKGGVGKTILSASLIYYLHNRGIKLFGVNCDVDAPNLELLFKRKETVEKRSVQTTMKSKFISENCTQCRKCIDESFCKFNALEWDNETNMPKLDIYACEGCGACEVLCEFKAFTVDPVDSGTIEYIDTDYGFPIITGETMLGASTSGKLVSELRKFALDNAMNQDVDVFIVDGPPGIGCPVIASISGLNYAIVVIEPTPTAVVDSKRAIEVLYQLKVPFGVVINKADSWEESRNQIIKFCEESNIEILGEIPVDFLIPESISLAIPVLAMDKTSEAIKAIKSIGEKVFEIVNSPEQ